MLKEQDNLFAILLKNIFEAPSAVQMLLPEEANIVSGTEFRVYRLALAADAEYTNVFRQAGDTDAQARTQSSGTNGSDYESC